jgi:hypothetical protein
MSPAEASIEVEIEDVFSVTDRGVFVGARVLQPDTAFALGEKPTLAGLPVERWLAQPRKLSSNGNVRLDYFVFKLVSSDDRHALKVGQRAVLASG